MGRIGFGSHMVKIFAITGLVAATAVLAGPSRVADAATLPGGFTDEVAVSGLVLCVERVIKSFEGLG